VTVIIQIQGREAIPVRAIPLLTNWRFMSPDVVAHVLGGTGGSNVSFFGDLTAYRLAGGRLQPIAMDWWVQFPLKKLNALTLKTKAAESIDEVGYEVWREQSLKVLPAGAFVWKDDYQKLHNKNWKSRYGLLARTLQGDADDKDDEDDAPPLKITRAEVDGDTPLMRSLRESLEILKRWEAPDFDPFMSPELEQFVMEGFRGQPSDSGPFAVAAPAQEAATPAPVVAGSAPGGDTVQSADPERRLSLLRSLGGNAKYIHGEWKISGITALVNSEKAAGCKRRSEKTIRADLKVAAETERDANRAGFADGLGQR